MSKIKNKIELLEEINKFVPIIDGINSVSNRIIKNDEEKSDLVKITKSIEKWKKKLSNPKFEVAIIGLEKAGKSTIANALLNEDFLPSAEARCTFTTATIESDPEKDEAVVEFYTKDEFNERFDALCEKIKLPKLNFDALSSTEFNKIVKEQEYHTIPNEVKDIKIMLENKESLSELTGKPIKLISSNIKEEVKPFIVSEDKSMAVKSIAIKSTELKELKDIIIYDVPGFDSPTKLHLEQATKYTDEADVVIMMVSIANAVSFVDSQVNFLNQTAKNGVSIIDKTIVIASKFDTKILNGNKEDSESRINDSIELLKNELKKYNIYREENVFKVSPQGYLEKNGKIEAGVIVNGKKTYHVALPNLESVNMNDGFDEFRVRLDEFFKTDALKALNDTVIRDIKRVEIFISEFKTKHNIDKNEAKLKNELYDIKKEYIKSKKSDLINLVVNQKIEIKEKGNFSIPEELENEISSKWIEQLRITDEKRIESIKEISTEGAEMFLSYNTKTRTELYKNSLKLITKLVSDVVITKDKEIINKFISDIEKSFNIKGNNNLTSLLRNELEKIMGIYTYDERSYKPLLARFLNDIFKLLITHPIQSNSKGQRMEAFENIISSIESILPFDKKNYENESELGIYEKTLVKKMLVQYEDFSLDMIKEKLEGYHDYFQQIDIPSLAKDIQNINISPKGLEKIFDKQKENFKDKTKDVIVNIIKSSKSKNSKEVLVEYAKEATTYEEVQKEINKDLDNLKDIISDVLLKAMMIEKPFLDSLNTQVEAIRIDLLDDDSVLNKFMDTNIEELDRENYNSISGDPELNKKILNIINQIESI